MQPGLLGSSVSNDGDIMRMIQDIERRVREIQAAMGRVQAFRPDGSISLNLDGDGLHATNTAGKEVSLISSITGELESFGDNGVIHILANSSTAGTSQTVPAISFAWTLAGTAQTEPAFIYSYENRIGIISPAQSTIATQSFLGINDDSWNLSCTDKTTGAQSGASVVGTNAGAWSLGSNAAAGSSVYGAASGTWGLGQAGNGPVVSSTAGTGGNVQLIGGTTNGSVNAWSYGTGSINLTGKTNVFGNFTVSNGTKNFAMTHPTDPAKTLVHASTESPENGVEYWGTATTDASGQALVTLPDYFEALTKQTSRAVLLTAQGATPAALSYDPIANGAFTVYGPAGQAFSWLVKAVRQQVVDGVDGLAFDPVQNIAPEAPTAPEQAPQVAP